MLIKVSVLFVIGVFAGTAIAASIDCNIDECRKPMKIYEELRCKAIYGAKSCCPKRFECADNVRKIYTNLCAFDGKLYKIGEVLRRNLSSDSKCHETCICSSSHDNEPAKFLCSTNNCDDISDTKVDDGCVKIYTDVKECCSTTTVCAEEAKKNLATCWDNSVSYREGEKFISKSNPCYECLCHKDFDNTTITENSHCRKLNCDIELKYKSFIQRGCLPIFENDKCCPIDWKCPDDGQIKKFSKRDVTEIEDGIVDDSNESGENFSGESSEELTDNINIYTTESGSAVTLNLDPYRTPKEEEEISMVEEQTKSTNDFATSKDLELSTELELPVTSPSVVEEQINNDESSTIDSISNLDEVFDELDINTEKEEELQTTDTIPTDANITDDKLEQDEVTEGNADSNSEIPSHNEDTEESNTEVSEGEELTTLSILSEILKDNDVPDTSMTEKKFINEKIPNSDLEAPKLEISRDLELPLNSLDDAFVEETTILPESSTFDSSQDTHLFESSTDSLITENIDKHTPTAVSEIEVTTESEITSTSTEAIITTPKVVLGSHRKPKLIIKPSIHVIPPPPSPTEFEQLLTTLKQYVERLENTLTATKASEIDPPATFVNYTVSRSFSGEEDEEKSISKRSAPTFDFMPRYFKHANKEKGCSYGKRQYKLGEKIRTDNECLDCLCLYSPIGHCTKKKECEA